MGNERRRDRERERDWRGGRVSLLRRIVKFLDAFSVSATRKADCSRKALDHRKYSRATRNRKDTTFVALIRGKLFPTKITTSLCLIRLTNAWTILRRIETLREDGGRKMEGRRSSTDGSNCFRFVS